jgi:V/A-type H+/Na+-transporting ATPase subunit I
MIVPMLKYSFLVFHADYGHFLEHLKELGVAHIVEHREEPTSEIQDLYRKISDLSKTIKILESRKKNTKEITEEHPEALEGGEELNNRIRDIEIKLEQAKQHLTSLQKEEKQLEPWGYFSRENIKKLAEAGLTIRYFMCPESKYDHSWEEKFPIELISGDEGYSYFVLVSDSASNELPEELGEVDEITLPNKNLDDVINEISTIQERTNALNKDLDQIALRGIGAMKKYQRKLEEHLSELNVRFQTVEEVEGTVRLIEAWVPELKANKLENWADTEGIFYIKEPARNHERPPILLRNNRFARLFEPISRLFSLPSYVELDMTPFFAPFFMMFFGFCLGDAGYGLLLVLGATLYKPKAERNMRSILSLVQFLGVATVLFGAITGMFFGINLVKNPPEFLVNIKNMFLDNDQMFNLALIFGGIQILFGMILKAVNQIRQHGIAYSFSTWGWFVLIVSSLVFYYLDTKSPDADLFFGSMHMAFLVLSAFGILVFNHPKRNIFVNIGSGLWDTYNMVTGIVGDLLSYIRLFALGLASAILGQVFNQLAFDLAPDIPVVGILVTLIILLIGHGINIFMSGLGSFVHPLRLTFVEFYKNAGFIGGGKEYKPFQKAQ